MYTKNEKVYCDPYHYFIKPSGNICFVAKEGEEITEIPFSDPIVFKKVNDNLITWEEGKCAIFLKKFDYANIKKNIVKLHYSNDDQIAIILNSDEDAMTKMQAWRDYAGDMGHKIMEFLEG